MTAAAWRLVLAWWTAWRGHRGQRDKAGKAYIYHLMRVAWIAYGLTGDVEAAVVGLLHDYFEDVGWHEVVRRRFGPEVFGRVARLTRVEMPYDTYINVIRGCGDSVVVAVKIADLLHNTDRSRGVGVAPGKTLTYTRALKDLCEERAFRR